MEVVALNERLRGGFSALLKLLPPPYAVSALSIQEPSIFSSSTTSSAGSNDRYTQHCRFMLWRLNSYQYGSASAFLLDLEQLERAAEPPELKQQVKLLKDRLAVVEGATQAQQSVQKVANSAGATVSLRTSCGVPGLQEVAPMGSEIRDEEAETTWLCNVSVGDQVLTIGTFKTHEEALQGYEEQRKQMNENPTGFNKLRHLAAKMEERQREEDSRVLKEALAQCHPRLTTMKVSTVTAPAVSSAAVVARAIPRSVARSLAAASSPAPSPAPSEAGESPLRVSRASKRQKVESSSSSASSSTKKQKGESASTSAASNSSAGNKSYLKLRRLIQKKLCRHLKSKEVCVLSDPSKRDEARLRATGRLEGGKVFSFRRKKQMSFADYVRDELGRAESACAHMFLVRTKESIDDHLKVCDAFSDKERELGPRRPTQAAANTRKPSRRSR